MWRRLKSLWTSRRGAGFFDSLLSGLAYYYLTTVVVLLGVAFGAHCVKPARGDGGEPKRIADRLIGRPGVWYGIIASSGYTYNPDRFSIVALFPAYPMAGRFVAKLAGVRVQTALLLVSHVSLAAAFIAIFAYVRRRWPGEPSLAEWAVVALGLLPTTVFFRMAYSESLFLLVTVLFLTGIERRWPATLIALVVGLATATRPVGLALLPPFWLWLWQASDTKKGFLLRAALLTPLACWGLAAYVAFQWVEFGEPLAFAKTQLHWPRRRPALVGESLLGLLTLEPMWSVYVPSSTAYWARYDPGASPLFSLQFANPIFFVMAAGLLAAGAAKRWLTPYEWLLGAMLLLIPYVTLSYPVSMAGMGRYAASAVPVYLVLGHVLLRMPAALAAVVLAAAGFLLAAYSALFAGCYLLI